MKTKIRFIIGLIIVAGFGCTPKKQEVPELITEPISEYLIVLKGTDYIETTGYDLESPTTLAEDNWLSYEVDIETAGRYQIEVGSSFNEGGIVWIEDNYDNSDGEVLDVTGWITIGENGKGIVNDSPFNAGKHKIKVHGAAGEVTIKEITFKLIEE